MAPIGLLWIPLATALLPIIAIHSTYLLSAALASLIGPLASQGIAAQDTEATPTIEAHTDGSDGFRLNQPNVDGTSQRLGESGRRNPSGGAAAHYDDGLNGIRSII